ncbi:sodium:proton antiporter [Salegentibacter salinarum]|uniref:Na(+)/H(+) antiporter NhaA n=1 Tax=Salegentibacter salinarum TaxID=447422 RepID=A0A2N0TMX5_9FLAO|nr:Na+/H+ antiporter NhaA [Salegentibacter salinarum]PKD16083.1 sodium:proton antiporter [Salegentibacter salinarum]SKB69532.1 Na+:H+ antiporter, NhaA family [Salegentibacter salinarum]
MKKSPLDLYLLLPIKNFIEKKTSVGLLLIFSAILAMIVANSPLADAYHNLWKQYIHLGINDFVIRKNLLHWINDGLMSIFFFMIGLELKREILQGELSSFRKSILPIAAAIGGMVFPALIYFYFNTGLDSISGWGIPMATDIAFALGILYLLGDRVPLPLKVFLTAIAIVDDLGAVLVIAFFYTSDISVQSLAIAGVFVLILAAANLIGIRNTLFYAIMGIGGLWLAILLSGVHATIAAVLAAFAIPNTKRINTPLFLRKTKLLAYEIKEEFRNRNKTPKEADDHISHTIQKFTSLTEDATPPLQRLEHALYPFVSFVVLPIFAFANAGVSLGDVSFKTLVSPVTIGVMFGLIFGKFIGIVVFSRIMVWTKIASLPNKVKWKHVYGIGFLAAIGFTMSLFITELAFKNENYLAQAKIGILSASLIAGLIGYFYLRKTGNE